MSNFKATFNIQNNVNASFDKVVSNNSGGTNLIYCNTRYDFPNVGNSQNIYIARDETAQYIWDEIDLAYKPLGLSATNFGTIVCGDASTIYD